MKKSEMAATIEALMQENQRLVDMFKKEIYIESMSADPEHYNLCLRGKGAMLIIGQLIEIFRSSGGKNFLTNTLQLTLPDGKTRELFELTIQKVDGEDSPAMKIERLEKENQELKEQLIKYQRSEVIGDDR
ncbi:hypothetical protein M0R72_19970 [Candidatus Pacearchaeota archaeon]|jgi:hypothetical protein|nr:hypothetical protein [Candidatus Pacearchaeota archaeon]